MGKEILERQVFGTGAVLFRAGEPPRSAYLIQSGSVNIVLQKSGVDEVVGTVQAGELVGEMALVDAQPRSATAVAREATTCIVITPADFERRLERSDAFVRAMVKILTQRLRRMTGPAPAD